MRFTVCYDTHSTIELLEHIGQVAFRSSLVNWLALEANKADKQRIAQVPGVLEVYPGRARRREEAKSQRYCDRCCTQRYTTVIQRAETYPVLGEPTTITANVCVCRTCGTDLFDMELDEANLTRAYIQAGCVQTEAGRWTKPEASECEFPSPTE